MLPEIISSVINTKRLLLRPLLHEDAVSILFIRSNDIVNKYINRPKSITIEDAHIFLSKIEKLTEANDCIYRAIILKETNELIGTICYFHINKSIGFAEIGYELHPDHHNKGFMQEAIETMISFGRDQLNLKTIVALVYPENERSIHLLKKNNFLPDSFYKYVSKKNAGELLVYYLLINK